MFSSAWHSCLASLSRAADCPDRYGAKSRTGISAASLLFTGEGAALIVNIPLSRIGIQPVRFDRNCRKARSDHATGIVFGFAHGVIPGTGSSSLGTDEA